MMKVVQAEKYFVQTTHPKKDLCWPWQSDTSADVRSVFFALWLSLCHPRHLRHSSWSWTGLPGNSSALSELCSSPRVVCSKRRMDRLFPNKGRSWKFQKKNRAGNLVKRNWNFVLSFETVSLWDVQKWETNLFRRSLRQKPFPLSAAKMNRIVHIHFLVMRKSCRQPTDELENKNLMLAA